MSESKQPRRRLAAFLTGQADDVDEAAAPPQQSAPPPQPTPQPQPPQPQSAPPQQQPQSAPPQQQPQSAPPQQQPQSAPPQPQPQPQYVPAQPQQQYVPVEQYVEPQFADSGDEYYYDEPGYESAYDNNDKNWVRYRSSWGGFFRFVVIIVLILIALRAAIGWANGWIDDRVTAGGPGGEEVQLEILDGMTTNDVATLLADEGVISDATIFRYWLRCDRDLSVTTFLRCDNEVTFAAGEYVLNSGMTYEAAVAKLGEGPIIAETFSITVPEGMRWTQMKDRMVEENPAFNIDELETAYLELSGTSPYLDADVPYGIMEGMLFPATYEIAEEDLGNEAKLLRTMADTMDGRLDVLTADATITPEIDELGLSTYDVVVLASLIEEEALIPEDRPKIARVLYNRLLAGEKLGIDASACYAPNIPCSELTQSVLDDPNGWNTRAVNGVPITPISAPGDSSLDAAFHPADGDWIYYTLTNENDVPGAHSFAVTDEERAPHLARCVELGLGCG